MAVSPTGLQRAREGFAHLMAIARERKLTPPERKMLSQFRQILRREKRPAMNPRPKYIGWIDSTSVGVGQTPEEVRQKIWDVLHSRRFREYEGGRKVTLRVTTYGSQKPISSETFVVPLLENPKKLTRRKARLILHEGKVRGHRLTPRQRRMFGARASGYPPRKNPSRGGIQRIGKALEVRYHRSVGRSPGYYKHEIESQRAGVYTIPPGWLYVGSRSILITEREPRVP